MNMLNKIKRVFLGNKALTKKMIQCKTVVDKKAVTRTNINGVEHIVITSRTLPDNIVMNGGMYPAEEIEKSFNGLDRTLAPIEHPTDSDGNFISANDPVAIHNFHAGAFNSNVRREDGRVVIDKIINVQEAMKSDRGKRLLDRIEEIENNDDARPIHTSVGAFVNVENLESPQTNEEGQEYIWIARDIVFDHDAILLDSLGAAQPHQGVGMAVNEDGKKFKVEQINLENNQDDSQNGEMSHSEIRESIELTLNKAPFEGGWVSDIIGDRVIFWSDDLLFQATFKIVDRKAEIVDVPVEVERDVTYIPKTNQEGDAMKDLILNALKAAGIETDGLTDEQLIAKYNDLQLTQNSGGNGGTEGDHTANDTAAVVASALEPVLQKLGDLETKMNSKDDEEIDSLAKIVGNSEKYPGIDADSAKKLGVDTLKGMVANCQPSVGIPLTVSGSSDGNDDSEYEMPK